jgi:hypothetical protein
VFVGLSRSCQSQAPGGSLVSRFEGLVPAESFLTGRDLAAWLGLTPLQKSTGGKPNTGKIVASSLTRHDIYDGAQISPLLDQVAGSLASITGDGAYDQEGVYTSVVERHPDAAVIALGQAANPIRLDRDLVLFFGSNGFGKTSLAEAIEWLFYGFTKRRRQGECYSKAEYASTYANVHKGRPVQVDAKVTKSGVEYVLSRRLVDGDRGEAGETFVASL